jgi:hypothetical protein
LKAQVSTEFMFMILAGMFVIIIFMTLFSELYQDSLKDKKRNAFEDFSYSLQNEFILASQVHVGYRRTFLLPEKLDGFDYGAYITESTLVINYTDNTIQLPIPKVKSNLIKENNIIFNQDNNLTLN